jgi:dTDP-4-dehydrorhamnose 3,5-epimerase
MWRHFNLWVNETSIEGLLVLNHDKHHDIRGSFERTYCKDEFLRLGLTTDFAQTSLSFNKTINTLRGLHYQQNPHQEVKLVKCLNGIIYDVVVDLRENSPTYHFWHSEILNSEDGKSILVPEGCAHGFLTLKENTTILYQISAFYNHSSATGVRWNDPKLSIVWPKIPDVISERDNNFPLIT